MSKNTVRVYDTITKKYVEIEVSEMVRTYYNRTQWNIDDNDKSFYKHEIQFSALKGSIGDNLENFKEFRTDNDMVEKYVIRQIENEELHNCLAKLSDDEQKIIDLLYFKNLSTEECGKYLGITHQAISKKRNKILLKLHKFLK